MSRLASPTSSFFINEVIKGGWSGEGGGGRERGSGLERESESAASCGALGGGRTATAVGERHQNETVSRVTSFLFKRSRCA